MAEPQAIDQQQDTERLLEVAYRCAATRVRRQGAYGWYRMWYERGTEFAGAPARYNKLESFVDLLTSYLYAPDSARFSMWLPPRHRAQWLDFAAVARDEFAGVWRDTGADVVFGNIVEWSQIYGGALAKVLPDPLGTPRVCYVYPGDFGVLREEVASIDDQMAFCHWYWLSVPEVDLLCRGHKYEADIRKWARDSAIVGPANRQFPPMVQQMIVQNMASNQPSGLFTMAGLEYPETQEPLVEFCELWERVPFSYKREGRHTTFMDYWVTTLCNQYEIMGRRNPVLPWQPSYIASALPGENPFVMVSASQRLDFFWGRSVLPKLLQLQNWRETRMNQIDQVFALQADPPRWGSGMGLTDEKILNLRKPGSVTSSQMPNAKIESIKIEMPDDPWAIIQHLDDMFSDAGGIPPILAGEQQAGMRAGNQVGAVANISVGRLRRRALYIEDAAEVTATKMWHLMQRHDDATYTTPKGQSFLLSQLPPEARMRVDAHSASPVYAEQVIQKATMGIQAKALTLPDYIRLLDLPDSEALVERARDLQEAQAENAKAMLQIEMMKARKKSR